MTSRPTCKRPQPDKFYSKLASGQPRTLRRCALNQLARIQGAVVVTGPLHAISLLSRTSVEHTKGREVIRADQLRGLPAVLPRSRLATTTLSGATLTVVARGGSAAGGSALSTLSIVLAPRVRHSRDLAPRRRNQADACCSKKCRSTDSEILGVSHGKLLSPSTELIASARGDLTTGGNVRGNAPRG
jgi:hypothetical protein